MRHPVLIISVLLVILLATAQTSAAFQTRDPSKPQTATSNPNADKIRKKLRKVGTGGRITVELTNTHGYHGTIKWIDEDSFQIDEVDLNQVVSVNYNDVKRVDSGYTTRGVVGNVVTERTRTIVLVVALGAVVVGAVVLGKALRP